MVNILERTKGYFVVSIDYFYYNPVFQINTKFIPASAMSTLSVGNSLRFKQMHFLYFILSVMFVFFIHFSSFHWLFFHPKTFHQKNINSIFHGWTNENLVILCIPYFLLVLDPLRSVCQVQICWYLFDVRI